MAITNITMENHQFFNGKTHYLFRLPTISIHAHLVLPPSIRSARLATRHCTVSSCPRAAAVRKAVSPEKSRRSWKGRGRASPVFSRLNLKRRWVWNILYQIGMLYIYDYICYGIIKIYYGIVKILLDTHTLYGIFTYKTG